MSPPARPLEAVEGLTVSLWDPLRAPDARGRRWVPVGYLSAQGHARRRFTYFPDYEGPPLDPLHLDYRDKPPGAQFMPENGEALFGVFRDMLPGHFGLMLLTRHFPAFGRFDDLAKLAWFGSRVQSGLLFETAHHETPERYIDGMPYLEVVRERMIRFQLRELSQLLDKRNFYGLTSIGGARPKAAVQLEGRYWIAKFNMPNDPYQSLARVEHASLRLAAEAGLSVPESRVITLPESGEDVLLVSRYDRSSTHRAHRISLKTLTGIDNTGAYGAGSTADFQDIDRVLKAIGGEGGDQDELIRRLAFMAGAGVADNHLGNFEMLLDERNAWRLTPAYDLVPVPGTVDFSTRLCGFANSTQALTPHLVPAVARLMKRPFEDVRALIHATWAGMAQHCDRILKECGVSEADRRAMHQAVPIERLMALTGASRNVPAAQQIGL